MGIATFIFALLIASMGLPATTAAHDFTGRCDQCHDEAAPVAANALRADIETLCRRCHRLPERYSHPTGQSLAEELPAPFAGHGQGQLTCTTCHDPHPDPSSRNPALLRSAATGSAFCEGCHPPVEESSGRHLAVTPLAHRKPGLDRGRQAATIDRPSLGCLGCHDGTAAQAVAYCLQESRGGCDGHVVGVAYSEAAANNRKLAPMSALAPEIFLPEGLVSCLTCHTPYSDAPSMVVTTVPGAFKLCTECHLM